MTKYISVDTESVYSKKKGGGTFGEENFKRIKSIEKGIQAFIMNTNQCNKIRDPNSNLPAPVERLSDLLIYL